MTIPARWDRQTALDRAAVSGYPVLDLSLGVAPDAPPPVETACSAGPTAYPASVGTPELRSACCDYLSRRFGVTVPVTACAACAGAKEFIATLPVMLRDLGTGGDRDVVLIPSLGYAPYSFGARLAGFRVHRVPVDGEGRMDVAALPADVVSRALCLWVCSPANPTGVLEPLTELADWARAHGILLLSDEAYAETTWSRRPSSVLENGLNGVVAVHSVSKRSNAPGLRAGFYAGDPVLVAALVQLRRSAGLIASESAQATATRLFTDDQHADRQRSRARDRLTGLVNLLNENGLPCRPPDGGLFAWVIAPGGDGLAFAYWAAERTGIVVTPGTEYGPTGHDRVRIAAVRDPEDIAPRVALLSEYWSPTAVSGRLPFS